jgi:hypothetical protein
VSTRPPFTRTLPYVLRDKLASPPAQLIVGTVTGVPDAKHVNVNIRGTVVKVPRLKSYSAPAVNDAAQILAVGSVMIAIGAV